MVWLSAGGFSAARGKRVQVPFFLSGAARVTLTIVRGKTAIAELSITRNKAGRGSLTWNGRTKLELARKGLYTITIQATPPAGAVAHDTATLRIT